MDKRKLRQVASQIKKVNNAIKQAINTVSDYQRLRFPLDLEEEDTIKLATLLKDYLYETEFESPFGFYASLFQDFDDDTRILEKANKLMMTEQRK